MCEICASACSDVDIVIEFPASGSAYEYEEYGVYAYDEYPQDSVNARMTRRRALGRYNTLEEAKQEHPEAAWNGGGSGFIPVTLPETPPEWFDPLAAGESWDGE